MYTFDHFKHVLVNLVYISKGNQIKQRVTC